MIPKIKDILKKYKVIAIVGLSRNPNKDSYLVAQYLINHGYKIVPINPNAKEILGIKCYPSLEDLPDNIKNIIEIIDIFRPSEEVEEIVNQAIKIKSVFGKPYVIWMQLGISNDRAVEKAKDHGFIVIQNRCIKIEHSLLGLK